MLMCFSFTMHCVYEIDMHLVTLVKTRTFFRCLRDALDEVCRTIGWI